MKFFKPLLLVILTIPSFTSTGQQPFTALIDVIEDNVNLIDSIVANSGYHTIYSLEVDATPGDIFRIRGQVEMTNDKLPLSNPKEYVTVRGSIRISVDGLIIGSNASQNNPLDPNPPSHSMHHMPLWTDALYTVSHNGKTKVEVQYAVTKSSSSPAVKIEPYQPSPSTTPYGHLVIEHYHRFISRQAAQDSLALGLDTILADKIKDAPTFYEPTIAYSVQCKVDNGDIIRLLGQATSTYIDQIAFHGQIIQRNGIRISPASTENIVSRLPDLPLWTDAIDKPTVNKTNDYTIRLHSLIDPDVGAASIAQAGNLYCLKYKSLSNSQNAKQLAETKIIDGPQANYSLLANSGWQNIISYSGQAMQGDILKVTGFSQFSIPNTYQYGINCQFRIKINGEVVQSGKYITELLEVLPLRAEIIKIIDTTGTYAIDVEVFCSRSNANPTITVLGGKSGILLERFSYETTTGISDFSFANSISFYPNPANDFVTITNLPIGSTVKVLDITGKVVYSSTAITEHTTINTTDFAEGIYLFRIEHDGSVATKKLLVNK